VNPASVDPRAPLELMADRPLLLLPVRLETRFEETSLLIRVFPDSVHLDRSAPPADPSTSADPRPPVQPRLLPDYWIAAGWFVNKRLFLVRGKDIREQDLHISPDLGSEAPDARMKWLFDFEEAEKVGMALRAEGMDNRALDRLLVFGVRSSRAPEKEAKELEELLRAHQGSDGLAFVAPGTPTNQVQGGAGALAAPTPGAASNSAGARTIKALGLTASSVLQQIDGAERDEETVSRAMNTAIWPAAPGYFLSSLVSPTGNDGGGPSITQPEIDQTRAHFIEYVRAAGSLPSLQVGDQPYGLLPTSSLSSWKFHKTDLAGLVELLIRFRPLWLAASGRLPRPNDDPSTLLEVLRTQHTAQRYEARTLMGRQTVANLFAYMGVPSYAEWRIVQESLGVATLRNVGLPWRPCISHGVFAEKSFGLRGPLAEEPQSKSMPVTLGSGNYILWMRDAEIEALRQQVNTPRAGAIVPFVRRRGRTQPEALFYRVLRHATLLAYADAALRVLRRFDPMASPWVEPELPGFGANPPSLIWTLFEQPLRGISDTLPLGKWIRTATAPETQALAEHRASLTTLAAQSADVLARHFTGTLDLCSYRLDAWRTSVATRRLALLRSSQPEGIQIGGYGWLEHLTPRAADQVSDGYITAPSQGQAMTAAILRSGYRSRRIEGQPFDPLAVDLSSERVRIAEDLLDGVRQGQSIGEVLGYRFERALHDAQLDLYIDRFRSVATAQEGRVVDGLLLLNQWRDDPNLSTFQWGSDRPALERELIVIRDALDAVADLMLAEGVHQVVRGNPEKSAAVFDAIGKGEKPPPPLSVSATSRRAVHHTIRLLVGFRTEEAVPSTEDWPSSERSQRPTAEPVLNAWAAQVLGPARAIQYQAEWRDALGTVIATSDVNFASTGLSPLDTVYTDEQMGSWLVWQARRSRPASVPGDASLTLRLDGMNVLLELARSLRAVFAQLRPARVNDFRDAPEQEPADPNDPRIARAEGALAALSAARADLEQAANTAPDQLATPLLRMAFFGIAGCLVVDEPAEVQQQRAKLALQEADRRLKLSQDAAEPQQVLDNVFGGRFATTTNVTISAAAAQAFVPPDADKVIGWVSCVGRAREGAARLDDIWMYEEAKDRELSFSFAQLPQKPQEPSLITAPQEINGPRTGILVYWPTDASIAETIAAAALDEWVEAAPLAQQTAGMSFHYDRPNSQPPQAMLLAIPPDLGSPWNAESIESLLSETLDLAAIRAVPPEALGELAQYLPATLFAFNVAGETVSTDFSPLVDQ
jgi:hypothetical protein